MATCPAGLRTTSKIAEGGAGIGRVTSMRSGKKTVSGTVGEVLGQRTASVVRFEGNTNKTIRVMMEKKNPRISHPTA